MKRKNSGGIYPGSLPVNCDKFDKMKQESAENTDSKPKKLTLFEEVYPWHEESPNDPPLSPLAVDDDDDDDDDDEEEKYNCEMTDNAGSSSDDTDYEEHPEQKFLVFESCLKLLVKFCSKRGGTISQSTETTSGSMFSVKMLCFNSHLTCLNSQPLIKIL